MVEGVWDDKLAAIEHSAIPKELHGQERIQFHQARAEAQRRRLALFPDDPPDED